MDTRLLRIFRAVATHGGLTRAAKELHLTPSALSHALRSLEDEVSCRLFERIANRLVLNQAGEYLLAGIEGPLEALERTANSVRELSRWGEGRLRIGAPVTACQYLVPPTLSQLRKEFPRLQLLVETGDMPHLVGLLRQGHIDLALGVDSEPAGDLELRPLFEDELLFVTSSRHPWSDGRTVTREEIARETLILYRRNSPTARLVHQYLKKLRSEPRTTMEVASITAIKEMVALDLGVAVLAPWTVSQELARGSLCMRPLGPRALRRRWVIAQLASQRLALAGERFCKLCRSQATGLRRDRRDLPARAKS